MITSIADPVVCSVSTEQIRALESVAMSQIGDGVLMQRAAAGLAAVIMNELRARTGGRYGRYVVLLVGPGNNGGDALYAGVRLLGQGVRVTAVRCIGAPHHEGAAAFVAAGGRWVNLDQQREVDHADAVDQTGLVDHGAAVDHGPDLVVDGLLGIGGRAGLPERVGSLLQQFMIMGTPVVAVDLPSGAVADTGEVGPGAVRADATVTFGHPKHCHLLEPARTACGTIHLVDIGLGAGEPELLAWTPARVAAQWPTPGPTDDKYSRGVVGLHTGSSTYPGAGLLTAYGAVHGGAGMVRYLGPSGPAALIGHHLPNVVFAPGRVQARLYGSGWGPGIDAAAVLSDALTDNLPTVVDADGIAGIRRLIVDKGRLPELSRTHWLLTPHAGELARLLDIERSVVTADPVAAVRRAADATGATVLLKGATQLVAVPDLIQVSVAVAGPAWTGQAGSGDTLAGICAALLAAGKDAATAAVLGASIQAMAAGSHPGPLPPHRLAELVAVEIGGLADPDHDVVAR